MATHRRTQSHNLEIYSRTQAETGCVCIQIHGGQLKCIGRPKHKQAARDSPTSQPINKRAKNTRRRSHIASCVRASHRVSVCVCVSCVYCTLKWAPLSVIDRPQLATRALCARSSCVWKMRERSHKIMRAQRMSARGREPFFAETAKKIGRTIFVGSHSTVGPCTLFKTKRRT